MASTVAPQGIMRHALIPEWGCDIVHIFEQAWTMTWRMPWDNTTQRTMSLEHRMALFIVPQNLRALKRVNRMERHYRVLLSHVQGDPSTKNWVVLWQLGHGGGSPAISGATSRLLDGTHARSENVVSTWDFWNNWNLFDYLIEVLCIRKLEKPIAMISSSIFIVAHFTAVFSHIDG